MQKRSHPHVPAAGVPSCSPLVYFLSPKSSKPPAPAGVERCSGSSRRCITPARQRGRAGGPPPPLPQLAPSSHILGGQHRAPEAAGEVLGWPQRGALPGTRPSSQRAAALPALAEPCQRSRGLEVRGCSGAASPLALIAFSITVGASRGVTSRRDGHGWLPSASPGFLLFQPRLFTSPCYFPSQPD